VAGAVLLGVTDLLADGGRERIAGERLEALGVQLGEAAWAALDG
jgi:hypothetical protein